MFVHFHTLYQNKFVLKGVLENFYLQQKVKHWLRFGYELAVDFKIIVKISLNSQSFFFLEHSKFQSLPCPVNKKYNVTIVSPISNFVLNTLTLKESAFFSGFRAMYWILDLLSLGDRFQIPIVRGPDSGFLELSSGFQSPGDILTWCEPLNYFCF